MYSVEFSIRAKKQLDKLDNELKKRIVSVLDRIKIRPFYFLKKVVGSPYYRLRVGDHRIILDVKQNKMVILVVELGHRKKIYK